MAKIALFVGSVRKDRYGIKVARWFQNKLIERGHEVFFIDPMEIRLPLLDGMYKEMDDPPEELKILQENVKDAGAPSISSSFQIPQVHKVFDNDGNLLDEQYNTRVKRFLDEFDWYVDAFKNQRQKDTPY